MNFLLAEMGLCAKRVQNLCKIHFPSSLLGLPLRPLEEVSCCLFPSFLVGHHQVADHLRHVLVHEFTVHPFEAQEILSTEVCAETVIERIDNLG